eukprot:2246177-Lingulodinium_polyedra.AAC.1
MICVLSAHCKCALKTHIISQQQLDAWRRALCVVFFGADAVTMGGRYLGAWLARAARGALREGLRWERA